jgi:uncharacterized delta-60 repeat protein
MRGATVLLIGSLCFVPAVAADGMLDPSFGRGGLVRTHFDEWGPVAVDAALSVVVMGDGRAVAAGYTSPNLGSTHMTAARYLASGSLDTTFDGDGRVTVVFPFPPPAFDYYAAAQAVLVQPDGKVVLVGTAADFEGAFFALARLNADGSLDSSFGTDGTVLTNIGSSPNATAGLLLPDGRIVAVGHVGFPYSIAAARYNADGSLDPTFGGDGKVTIAPGSFKAESAVLQPDGKLVIAGTSPPGFPSGNFALARLLPDGTLDMSFGGDGVVSVDFGAIEMGRSVILLPDGRLVVAGSRTLMATPNSPVDIALARYLPDGSVDTTFGNGGVVLASMSPVEYATQVVRLPNGKLLAAGSIFRKKGDFLLARFLPDGVLDTTFGNKGFLRTDFGASWDECQAAVLAGTDLVLTAGSTGEFPSDFALARYILTTGAEVTSEVE